MKEFQTIQSFVICRITNDYLFNVRNLWDPLSPSHFCSQRGHCLCPSAGDIEGPEQVTRRPVGGWQDSESSARAGRATRTESASRRAGAPLPLGYPESRWTSRHLARSFSNLLWLVLKSLRQQRSEMHVKPAAGNASIFCIKGTWEVPVGLPRSLLLWL